MTTTQAFENNGLTLLERWVQVAELDGERDAYLSKRTATRITWGESLQATDVSRGNKREIFFARSRNVSSKGLCFLSRKPIPLHTQLDVHVEGNAQSATGEVVHCSTALGGFMVGVSFT